MFRSLFVESVSMAVFLTRIKAHLHARHTHKDCTIYKVFYIATARTFRNPPRGVLVVLARLQ